MSVGILSYLSKCVKQKLGYNMCNVTEFLHFAFGKGWFGAFCISVHILYIANRSRWKSFTVFTDRLVTTKLFQWNSLCNRSWPCKTIIQPQMFSSKLEFNFATVKLKFLPWAICKIQYLYTKHRTFRGSLEKFTDESSNKESFFCNTKPAMRNAMILDGLI